MVEVKKYWSVFILIFLFSVHILGPTLRGFNGASIGHAIGYLLIPSLIGFGIVYRAKTIKTVITGYITLAVLCGAFIAMDFNDTREDLEETIFSSCRYSNEFINSSSLSEDQKNKLCNCFTDATVDKLRWYVISRSFLFQTVLPIEQNEELQYLANKEFLGCRINTGLS